MLARTTIPVEILDLRHFSSVDLRPLLERESDLWMRRLAWDYSPSAEMILRYVDSKILPGYHIFIGFCLASLFLSRKLGKSLLLPRPAADSRSEEVEQHSRPE